MSEAAAIRTALTLEDKLGILADAAKYDASCASSGTHRRDSRQGGLGSAGGSGICHSYSPDGRCISLLKILMTNFCELDCKFCINRRSSNVQRARMTAAEIVSLTLDFYRRNYIEGLFLSSGIIRSADYTMAQLIEVARSLRVEHGFLGYIHLKTIPDADPELIREAGRYADRLSINVEFARQATLTALAPQKDGPGIDSSMQRIALAIAENREDRKRLTHTPRFAPAGQSTQMIIGADPTPDVEILERSVQLYDDHRLKRVYYSAYSPIADGSADLPAQPAPLLREHRLYQADWLIRFYEFSAQEITATAREGMLDLRHDPKMAWALQHPEYFPVDVNRGSREQLLRVPGMGGRSVGRLLRLRRLQQLRLSSIASIVPSIEKMKPFIVARDWRPRVSIAALAAPGAAPTQQLPLGF